MTELEYLKNTYVFSSSAKILDFQENENGKYIILDKTIFYPQGGGQPSDIGEIKKVKLNENGVVYHYGKTNTDLKKGKIVKLFINKDNRINNVKNHSAEHLIDLAICKLGFSNLNPTKGHHFYLGSYVEYEGFLNENMDDFKNKLNLKLKELINLNLKIIIIYDNLNIKTPTGKIPRYVSFEQEKGCGCGGTHINSTKEIGEIFIRKIKYK